MSFVVDARRLPCPQPVVHTIKAMEESDDITTIVSSNISKENVLRLAKDRGFSAEVRADGNDFHIHMVRLAPGERVPPDRILAPATPVMDKCSMPQAEPDARDVLLLTSDSIGRGDEELGKKLMTSFLQILGEIAQKPTTIIFMNSAVKLVVKGAPALEDLRDREKNGVTLLACGTCVGHYGLQESVEVGQISNMYDIATTLFKAGKIVSP